MGNASAKESRNDSRSHRPSLGPDASSSQDRPTPGARNRSSQRDLGSILGITTHTSSGSQPPYERRETKQEREARRLERERQARLVERERSIKEEHVDGGFLVTLGTYVGPEDFNKQVVRQLQIERKIAPFWRGLQDSNESWAEHQIIAAARGLPVPPADQTPPDDLIPRPLSADSPATSAQNLNSLMVPMGGRSLSVASDKSASNVGSALPSPVTAAPARGSSPFKPRAKALAAALNVSSRNGSTTEISPREMNLANDPFVNGQPLEVFLYKDASECPICFLCYPPYLNHTRCCDQSICSECFVQIKRADPHYPEGHGDNPEDQNANPEEQAGLLISEPACCPYCQQPDFGVTYEPPPFRRGLTYSMGSGYQGVGAIGTAMSSNSSLNSTLSPSSLTSPASMPPATTSASRRRTQSLSANAPNVISTDRVRPDWSTKLAAQRAQIARRAAAATALHTAAFLMGNPEGRSFRVGRFSRRNTGSGTNNEGEASPAQGNSDGGDGSPSAMEPGPRGSSGRGLLSGNNRRSRMEDLEELMFREALRQSLATEEERRRKSEKEERKEAKRREKEGRKAAKVAQKQGSASGPYAGSGSGHSSASGSTLSLSGLVGRRRGNSAASNLRVEASVASAISVGNGNGNASASASPVSSQDKGKAVDRGPAQPEAGASEEPSSVSSSSTSIPRPIPSPQQPIGPSHLRQMSSASSVSSSIPDSAAGSYQNPSHLQDPRASGLSLGSRSGGSEDGDHGDDRDPSNSTEPMFNFSSLAEMVGVQLEGENAGRRLSVIDGEAVSGEGQEIGKAGVEGQKVADNGSGKDGEAGLLEQIQDPADLEVEQSTATLKPTLAPVHQDELGGASSQASPQASSPPELMITPDTPAPTDDNGEAKQLGFEATAVERPRQFTQ